VLSHRVWYGNRRQEAMVTDVSDLRGKKAASWYQTEKKCRGGDRD